MLLEVDSAYQTECSMKAIRNGYGLLCFRFIIRSPSLRTSGVPYHINDIEEVRRLVCLQLVGHYVACLA